MRWWSWSKKKKKKKEKKKSMKQLSSMHKQTTLKHIIQPLYLLKSTFSSFGKFTTKLKVKLTKFPLCYYSLTITETQLHIILLFIILFFILFYYYFIFLRIYFIEFLMYILQLVAVFIISLTINTCEHFR